MANSKCKCEPSRRASVTKKPVASRKASKRRERRTCACAGFERATDRRRPLAPNFSLTAFRGSAQNLFAILSVLLVAAAVAAAPRMCRIKTRFLAGNNNNACSTTTSGSSGGLAGTRASVATDARCICANQA